MNAALQAAVFSRHVAIDLGSESGRVIVGTFTAAGLVQEELHRFATPSLTQDGSLRWDIPAIQAGIVIGLRRAGERGRIDSIGVDTWGVDYGIIGANGALLTAPFCYRDARTEGIAAELLAQYGEHAFFQRSGVRPLGFNTVFQLAAHVRTDPGLFTRAAAIIPISDVLHHWLSGVLAWERTQVGTWGLATPAATAWDTALIQDLGLPQAAFGPITATGNILGTLRGEWARAWGINPDCAIVVPGGHDTASAVAGMACDADSAAYISSGTWSLLGCIQSAPDLSADFYAAGYSNEMAVDGRVRLNRNIMGLWIIQECRRAFVAAGRLATYAELADVAAQLPASAGILDVDDPRFFAPATIAGPMPARIAAWCREQRLPPPADDSTCFRMVLDGLAAAYARALTALEARTGRSITMVNIVGGGAANTVLNQLTATACRRSVLAGPTEATATGSLVVQAQACGDAQAGAQARALARASAVVRRYEPATNQGRAHRG